MDWTETGGPRRPVARQPTLGAPWWPIAIPGLLLSLCLMMVSFVAQVHASNLALLSGTLRTFQKHACDDEFLSLKCPHGTTISIQLAQYGRQAPSSLVCMPHRPEEDELVTDITPENGDNSSCLAASSLQTVVDACQEKKTCRVQTSPQAFGSDPCPGIRKYVEVAYKCRPSEFRSKVICEGDLLHLKCHPASRIAIYSANFGRTHHGSLECPQKEGIPEEDCQASYATETVMRICHGRRKCSMTADTETFGNPCEEFTRKYLRVIYTCVPKRILKDRYQGGVDSEDVDEDSKEGDEELVEEPSYDPSSSPEFHETHTRIHPTPYKDIKKPAEPTRPSPTRLVPSVLDGGAVSRPTMGDDSEEDPLAGMEIEDPLQINCTTVLSTSSRDTDRVIGFITEWIAAYNFMRANSEKLILYLALSFGIGLIAVMSLIIGRLLWTRQQERRRARLNISDPLPDSFGDDFSDIDQDISDLTRSGREEASVEVLRYASRSTMRRQDSDTNPRAPMSRSHNNYYYS